MSKLLKIIVAWLIRKFGILLGLLIALLLLAWIKQGWQVVDEFHAGSTISKTFEEIQAISPAVTDKPGVFDAKLATLRSRLNTKKTEQERLETIVCLLPTCVLDRDANRYRVDAEIEVLSQTLTYVHAVRNGKKSCEESKRNFDAVAALEKIVQQLNEAKPWWAPKSTTHRNLEVQLSNLQSNQPNLNKACQTYRSAKAPRQSQIEELLSARYAGFFASLNELRSAPSQFFAQARAVFPSALWLLLGIILTPIGLKSFSYFCIAPLAARKFGVRLQPESSGQLMVLCPSDYLQRVLIKEGEEFLFDPALLRGAPDGAQKKFKFVLDWSMPLTSIASGMFMLTKVTNTNDEVVVLGTTPDAGNNVKLTVIEVPKNASLVLKPRCLAGIVQNADQPIRITRHWRFWNLGSWLTFQLRYVVFHGPAKLVLKGCGGIEVDAVDGGASFNQAATLGFSANLGYSVERCEPFFPYLGGKTQLFVDHFSAGDGYCLHEVTPGALLGSPWRVLTRPFGVTWDVFSKAFGL